MLGRRALFLMAAAGLAGASPPSLDALRWRKRVVLAFAPDASDARLAAQRIEVQRLIHGGDDRDLELVEVAGEAVLPAADPAAVLRRRFRVGGDAFEALLIGKDGGVKLRSATPIGADRLAAIIDAMPMRREEMTRRPG